VFLRSQIQYNPHNPRVTDHLCRFVCVAVVIAGLTPEVCGQDAPAQFAAESASPKSQPSAPPDTAKPPGAPAKEGGAPATPSANAPAANPAPAQDSVKRPTAEKYVPQKIDAEIRKNPDGLVTFNIVGQPWEAVLQWLSDASALSLDWQELPGDSLNLITTREYTMEQARDLINRHLLMRGFTMIVNGEVMSIMRTKDLNPAMVARVTPKDLESLSEHTICKVSFNLDWLVADEAVEELKPMLSSAGQIHKLSKTNRLEILDTAISLRHIWELLQDEQSATGDDQLVRAFRLEHRRAEDVIPLLRDLLKLQPPAGERPAGSSGMDPNMVMQMMQQMQQAMQQKPAAPGGGAAAPKETRLVLNQRENMILAQAAPDQMAIIERAIREIDVPRGGESGLLQNIGRMKIYRLESVDPQTLVDLLQQLGDLDPGTVLKVDKEKKSIMAWATLADHLTITTLVDKLDQSSRQFEVITLKRLDAEYVAGTIRMLLDAEVKEEDTNTRPRYFGFYDPNQGQQKPKERSFRIEADIENNRLLVNANSLEMDEIRTLLIKLGELPDPTAADDGIRVFEINPDENLHELQRRLEQYWGRKNQLEFDLPEELPGQDENKSSTEEKDADEPAASDSAKQKKQTSQDVTRRTSEASSVSMWIDGRRLPVKTDQALANATRGAAFDELLRQSLVPSKIVNSAAAGSANAVLTSRDADEVSPSAEDTAESDQTKPESPSATESPSSESPPSSEPVIDRKLIERLRRQLQKSQSETGESVPSTPENPTSAVPDDAADAAISPERFNRSDMQDAPIKFSVTPDGKLIASSRDIAALAELEALMGQVAAPRRSYKVFRLKYATPSWVTLNLKDFFKSEEQTKSGLEYDPWWGIVPSQKKTTGKHSLSKRRQPQFISDNFTSTILVRDADAKQLQTIEDLIAIYDIPEPSDSRSMRVTTIFRLKHAKATNVAAAVKDVFRDLLSSNDKALEKDDKGQRQASSGLVTFLPRGPSKDGGDGGEDDPIRFKGLLSIGIDDSSNTLIVSSSGTLMDTIGEMIESLDDAADSSSIVQVLHVDGTVDLGLIQERLKDLMKVTPASEQPGQQQRKPGQQPGMQPGENSAEAVSN
jgi:type II secretory pathway component GspD/PulD (secretin)